MNKPATDTSRPAEFSPEERLAELRHFMDACLLAAGDLAIWIEAQKVASPSIVEIAEGFKEVELKLAEAGAAFAETLEKMSHVVKRDRGEE